MDTDKNIRVHSWLAIERFARAILAQAHAARAQWFLIVETPSRTPQHARGTGAEFLLLCGFVALLSAGLVAYSQMYTIVWDEGFHILAAWLIKNGRRPYLDFCFPQTPLNAYWNAALMQVAGEGWRAIHAAAALFTGGAVMLAADFVFRELPVPRWRLAAAISAAAMVGLNYEIAAFSVVGQAYGICLFLIVAAFRATIASAGRERIWFAAMAGLLAGGAAASSLLIAAAVVVLPLWIVIYNRAGSGFRKLLAFIGGAAIPFLPVLWLFAKSPRVVWFNVLQYQALFRRVNWGDATAHDFNVLLSWTESSQALLLGLLSAAGVWFLMRRSDWDRECRAKFYLSGWIALATAVELLAAHPTFERYFLLTIPFVAILAAVGLYAIASVLEAAEPVYVALVLVVLTALAAVKTLHDRGNEYDWKDLRQIAAKVDQVTPPDALIWSDELVYFLTRRMPPPGLEFHYAQKLELPPDEERMFHIVSENELKRMAVSGVFSTVTMCDHDDWIKELKLDQRFEHREDVQECPVFWGFKK